MMNVKYISEKLEEIQEIKNNLHVLVRDIKPLKTPSKIVLVICNFNFSHFSFFPVYLLVLIIIELESVNCIHLDRN